MEKLIRRSLFRLTGALVFVLGIAWPAAAQLVDLQLVLAVDASGSVDTYRFGLQNQGYANAFRSPRVLNAIKGGEQRAIGVTMMQWTGPIMQIQVIGWTRIDDQASALAFADLIQGTQRQLFGGGTSVSGAIDASVGLMNKSPFSSRRRVIDISGDGSNNNGRPVTTARDDAVRRGFVINGLPITAVEPNLEQYYERNVIGGDGSFVIAVARYEDFADAIINKLVTEISALPSATKLAARERRNASATRNRDARSSTRTP